MKPDPSFVKWLCRQAVMWVFFFGGVLLVRLLDTSGRALEWVRELRHWFWGAP